MPWFRISALVLLTIALPLMIPPIASTDFAGCFAKYTLGYRTCWAFPSTTTVLVSNHTISVVIAFICSLDKAIPGVNLKALPKATPASNNALYSASLSV